MPALGVVILNIATAVTTAIGSVVTAVGGWASIGAFLSSPFGSLLLGIGIQLVSALFIRKPDAPSIEAAKINVRVTEPERWLSIGRNRQGGGVVFAEFDDNGNFWYIVVHSDTTLGNVLERYFDDVLITLDNEGYVETNDFCLTEGGEAYTGEGTKVKYYQIFTRTFDETNVVPLPVTELETAFPNIWTGDHKLTGTTFSVIKVKPIAPENRYKVLRWRGAIGVGEPSLSIVGEWSKAYNPETQLTEFTRNPVLIWAWYRLHRYGRNKSSDSINWFKIAEQAAICDIMKTSIDNVTEQQYLCDISVPESTERTTGEQQILMSCDAQLVFDDDGKCWPRVGYYYEPALKLYRNRDILSMESVEAQNGESLSQGVIVRYIDPDAKYTTQPSAPYLNPFYYVEGETPKYLVVDVLACQSHRQAMQIAKSISMRSQPEHKLLPTVGLRGLKARQERIVDLQYDNTFSGNYEIVTPTEIDTNGMFIGFGCVPVDKDRWNFLEGEERAKPINADSEVLTLPTLPTGVIVEYVNSRIEISYDPSPRDDWYYEFEYQLKNNGQIDPDINSWLVMTTRSTDFYAYSGNVSNNSQYFVRWIAKSTGGKASNYITPVPTVDTATLTLAGTPPAAPITDDPYTGFTISVTGGDAPYTFIDRFNRLPDGLSVNIATGLIDGTPTVIGVFENIIIRVEDSIGNFKDFPMFDIEVIEGT